MSISSASISLLKSEAGPEILSALADNDINEIMLNPDGVLWVEHKDQGMIVIGERTKHKAESFIRAVAGNQNLEVNERTPILETELAIDGSRFEATLPPVTRNPAFTIRKKAHLIYRFSDYVAAGIATVDQVHVIRDAIKDRKNILVCGGPGTGKTTFTNACIAELVEVCDPTQRIITLEDVPELQCSAKNTYSMYTTDEVDLSRLLRVSLRSRPDRILVGEVRDKSMLDLLKAWNTGSPGGIATVHANGAEAAIQRCSDLAQEANVPPPISLIVETVNIVVAIQRIQGKPGRRIKEIVAVTGHNGVNYQFKKL